MNPSGTRKDELLLSPDEFAIVHKLRRVLSGLDSHQAIDLLMSQLRRDEEQLRIPCSGVQDHARVHGQRLIRRDGSPGMSARISVFGVIAVDLA